MITTTIKTYLFLPALLLTGAGFSQQIDLIDEDFDSGLPGTWTHWSTNWGSSAVWSSNNGAITEASGPYFGAVSNWLQAPAVDLTGVDSPTLEFDLALGEIDADVELSVWYMTTGNWTFISAVAPTNNGVTQGWTPGASDYQTISIDLSQFSNESNIRFAVGSEYLAAWTSGVWYMDNFKVFGQTPGGGGTSIIEQESLSFDLFPNPANQNVNIVLGTDNVKNASVSITDLAGATVKEISISLQSETIDVSDLSAGVYLVNLMLDGHVSTQKLVVQ